MTDNCNHSDAEWNWGEAQPSLEHVTVPGYCPECGAALVRAYEFERQWERSTPAD